MSLRWKNQLPQLQPNFVDQAGVNATRMQGYQPGVVPTPASYAAQDMAGYNPNNVYMGRVSDRAGQPGSGSGYQFDSREIDEYNAQKDAEVQALQQREQAMQQIQQLEARLEEINARIAEIDKSMPGGAGNDKYWEIAAQRASIGDMTAYDSMMQRGATGYQTANAIDNALMDAEKLTWGLSADSAEDRMAARNQIEVALRKAKRDADQTGTKLPDSYYRLQAALDKTNDVGPNGMTAMEYANDLASKIEANEASDEDIKAGLVWAAQHPNSKYAKTIFDAAVAGKGKTEEAKAKAKKYKAGSDALFNEAANMSKKQLEDWWRGLSNEKKTQFKKYHKIDLVKGKVE